MQKREKKLEARSSLTSKVFLAHTATESPEVEQFLGGSEGERHTVVHFTINGRLGETSSLKGCLIIEEAGYLILR